MEYKKLQNLWLVSFGVIESGANNMPAVLCILHHLDDILSKETYHT